MVSDSPKTTLEAEGALGRGQIYVFPFPTLSLRPVFPSNPWNLERPGNSSVGLLGEQGLEGKAWCVGGKNEVRGCPIGRAGWKPLSPAVYHGGTSKSFTLTKPGLSMGRKM